MSTAISEEKREMIISHKKNGKKGTEIASWLFISKDTVSRIWMTYIETGSYLPAPQNCGRKPAVTEEVMNEIVLALQKTPDKTLSELIEDFKLQISQSALHRRLKKLGFTYKKRRYFQSHSSEKIL